jgi:MFS family permease
VSKPVDEVSTDRVSRRAPRWTDCRPYRTQKDYPARFSDFGARYVIPSATTDISGCAIQTGSVNIGMLIAGRAIAGMSIGVLSMIVPVYQAEISPPHARGLLSGWTQLMIVWGFFVANW